MLAARLRQASVWWIVFAVALVARTLHRPESHTVFPVFATSSHHWWNDAPLYDDYKPLDFFRYPPPFAPAFTPFALLGPRAGGVLWSLVSLGTYWLGLRRFWRDLLTRQPDDPLLTPFLLLALVGAVTGLWNAQSNALVVGLVLLGASAAVRQRWWTSAFWFSLSVLFKLTPLPLVLLACAWQPKHLAGRTVLLLAAGFLLPFLTRPPEVVIEQYRGWATHLAESANERWPGFRDAWTVRAVSRHLIEGGSGLPDLEAPVDESWYRVVQLSGAAAVLAASLWLKRRGSDARKLLLSLAGGSTWALLLGPAAEPPTHVFLAPFLAWGLVDRAWPRRWLVVTAAVLLLVLGWGSLSRPLWNAAPWLILTLPAGLVLFAAWLGFCFAHAAAGGSIRRVIPVQQQPRESSPCPAASSSCPPPSGPAIFAPPRPSRSPCASPVPTSR